MTDFQAHAKKLAEIGNLLADDLSVKAHTVGLSPAVHAALADWDVAAIEFAQAEREDR